MKLLFDENISYRIVKKIEHKLPNCIHISKTGLKMPAKDIQIWDFAKKNDFVIVTFNEDFEDLSNIYDFPPKVILLRINNPSTQILSDTLLLQLSEIRLFYQSTTYGLLEIFSN